MKNFRWLVNLVTLNTDIVECDKIGKIIEIRIKIVLDPDWLMEATKRKSVKNNDVRRLDNDIVSHSFRQMHTHYVEVSKCPNELNYQRSISSSSVIVFFIFCRTTFTWEIFIKIWKNVYFHWKFRAKIRSRSKVINNRAGNQID